MKLRPSSTYAESSASARARRVVRAVSRIAWTTNDRNVRKLRDERGGSAREGGREGGFRLWCTTAALDKRQLRPFVGEREPTVRAARAHGDVPSQCCAAHRAVVAPVPGCAGKGCSCKRLHAPCTRKARAMHGKRHAVGGSPSGTCPWKPGRTCHPPLEPTVHSPRCVPHVGAPSRIQRGAAADERQMLRTRTAWRHARKQKLGQNNGRTTNKRTLLASAAVRMQSRGTLHYVCCMLCTARGYALSRHAICEVARAHGLHAECAHPPQDA